MYRVTYFSFWTAPEHIENLDAEGRDEAVFEGRARQFKVVVTSMDDDRPETY
jgi:hypothetical protein